MSCSLEEKPTSKIMKSNQRREPLVSRVRGNANRLTGSTLEYSQETRGKMSCKPSLVPRINRRQHRAKNFSTTNNDREEEGQTEYCAISNNISSPAAATTDNYANHRLINQTQTTTTLNDFTQSFQIDSSDKRYARRRQLRAITRHDKLFAKRPSVAMIAAVVVVLALLSAPSMFITQTQAFFLSSPSSSSSSSSSSSGASSSQDSSEQASASAAGTSLARSPSAAPSPAAAAAAAAISSLSSSLLSAATDSGKSSGDKQATSAADGSSSGGDAAKSVVASLSSAVASAAAAAAVAAAQSSLSGSDGRSLFSQSLKSHQNNKANHHLALKLADSIPEVPYNILHNMKKVDHAAPFYNSPNKLSGSSKESGQHHSSFLSQAMSSSSSSSFNEQLGSLFKSPLWKRISDGYGEFASEFRSLFKHSRPTTMKGPASSSTATKLIRDISVPALLMLIASAIPSDWRPIRTRRRSFPFLPPTDPMSAAGSDMIPTYSMAPPMFAGAAPNLNLAAPQQQQSSLFSRALSPMGQTYNQMDQSSPMARVSDINLQPATSSWMQPAPSAGQQQSIRRSGDISSASSGAEEKKLVDTSSLSAQNDHQERQQQRQTLGRGLFSSFTSGLVNQVVGGQARLVGKLMNANAPEMPPTNSDSLALDPSSYRMAASLVTADEKSVPFFTKIMKWNYHEMEDKHRYSLIGPDGENGNPEQQQQAKRHSNPISAMTQALGSIFTPSLLVQSVAESGSSPIVGPAGSSSGKKSPTSSLSANQPSNGQLSTMGGDKMINQHDSLLRRQTGGDAINMEQRELSQLIPHSWREVVKRTVNNVQQTASTQWRSFEGQLTNWVQDKLKAFPSASSQSSSPPSSVGSTGPARSNIIAAMGSNAVTRILGLGGNASSNKNPAATTESSNQVADSNSSSNVKSKNDSQPNRSTKQPGAKGALAGVANMIANTFSGRPLSSSSSHHTSKAKSPSGTGANEASSSSDKASYSSSSPSSGNSDSTSSSMASGTSSTVAALSMLGA